MNVLSTSIRFTDTEHCLCITNLDLVEYDWVRSDDDLIYDRNRHLLWSS